MKEKKTKNKLSPNMENFSKSILNILRKSPESTFNYKQIAAKLGVDDPSSRNKIIRSLSQLAAKKKIVEESQGKFKIAINNDYYTGTLDMTTKGSGYVIVEEMEQDVFIPQNNLNKALDGDEVEIYIYKHRKNAKSEGEVVRIINRKKTDFVGVLQLHKTFGFVKVQDPKMYTDIFIPKEETIGANDGDKVVVTMQEWPEKADSPFGKVKEVLGRPGEHETEMHSILAQYGLPLQFPEGVEEFAAKIDTSIQASEIEKRRDMRDVLTFTIDPRDAKDFDDALSFVQMENGNYEIGIHIADVSHYLKPGTVLYDEAFDFKCFVIQNSTWF
jgi:ribonuclease R/exosome complex exonuclease DIS3/RRP44